jgi:hypothetical protein
MDLRSLTSTEVTSGFPFVATSDEVAAMDMLVGPTRPMMPGKRGGRRVMVRDCVIPHRMPVWFLDVIVSSISPSTRDLSLELVGSDGAIALYRFPSQVMDRLSEFTPDRVDFVREEIDSITKRVLERREVREHYREGGVRGAVLEIRGDALKAVPRGSGKEVYYWCYRTADSTRLRGLEPRTE